MYNRLFTDRDERLRANAGIMKEYEVIEHWEYLSKRK